MNLRTLATRSLAALGLGPASDRRPERLGDFTTPRRVILIAALAVGIGVLSAFVALALLRLIGLITNLVFYQRWQTGIVSVAGHDIGLLVLVVPAAGGLLIGLMARFGSERIRGHGIPEAIEAILMHGSRVQPRVAFLKPLSSAVSIGTGGPFGAEGPIIMTGGAFGSLVAQFGHLTSAERKTLLVAGAAGGMSATFAAPVASVLIAVELLLFEWKPRSLIPVAMASATAALVRHWLLGAPPLFPVPEHAAFIGLVGFLGCAVVGLSAGALSALLTAAVYATEDLFQRLPLHWMWWPAIGGLGIGLGGLIYPEALGVGYVEIERLLNGDTAIALVLGILLVKSTIWAFSLGSGTSGGVLAPLLLMGGALGAIESSFLPDLGAGFWPLIAMAAILGGTMRSPLTALVFAIELTYDVNALLPLLVAVTVAHGFSVLALRRSILTEKISRRGYHLGREYALDPNEIIFAREAMRTNLVALPGNVPVREIAESLGRRRNRSGQRLYPIVDDDRRLTGVISARHLDTLAELGFEARPAMYLSELAGLEPVVAFADEPLRVVLDRMAETGVTTMPVVARAGRDLEGIIALSDIVRARAANLDEERRRERILRVRLYRPSGRRRTRPLSAR